MEKKEILGVLASTTMIVANVIPMAGAQTMVDSSSVVSSNDVAQANVTTSHVAAANAIVAVRNVEGLFTFNQDEVASNAMLARDLGSADKYLCNAGDNGTAVSDYSGLAAEDWPITVDGDVENTFTATIGDLSKTGAIRQTLSCSCGGNRADGRATANADVTGVTLRSLLEAAQVDDTANTITFTSSDGYTVSLPLFYVEQRMSVLVYEVNGTPLSDSVGGTNQLWLGATSARYFSRDVVRITLSTEKTVPPAPGTPEAGDIYDNVPNVGITEVDG